MKGSRLCLFSLCLTAASVFADSFLVTSTDDHGTGTLRDALLMAMDGDRIFFDDSLSGTILLQSALPVLNDNIMIFGPKSNAVAIDGNSLYPIFEVNTPSVTISNLQLNDGSGAGGALYVHANDQVFLNFVSIKPCSGAGCSQPIFLDVNGMVMSEELSFQNAAGDTFLFSPGSALTIEASTDSEIAIDGVGTLLKQGSSLLNLTAPTIVDISFLVDGGTLEFNGSTIEPIVITSNGVLSGNNSSSYIFNNGVVRPENVISTISDFTQNKDGSLQITLSPSTGAAQLGIAGNAKLDGTLTLLPQDGPYFKGEVFTFLTTGGVVDQTFRQQTSERAGIVYDVLYFPQSVEIEILKNVLSMDGTVFSGSAGSVQTVLENAAVASGSDLATIITGLNALDADPALGAALDNLSGASFGVLGWANATTMNHIISELSAQRLTFCGRDCIDSKPACCTSTKKNGLWAAGIGEKISQKILSELDPFRSSTAGALVGYDRQIGENYLAGLSAGYTQSHLTVTESGSKIKTDGYHASTYHSFCLGKMAVDASFLGSVYRYDSTRKILSLERKAHSHFGGYGLLGHVGVSVPFATRAVTWYPFAGADYIYLNQGKVREHGGGATDLRVKGRQPQFVRSEVGLLAKGLFCTSWGTIAPSLGLSWVYFTPLAGTSFKVEFVDAPGPFRIHTTTHAFNAAAPSASLGWIIRENGWLSLSYRAELSDHRTEQELNLTARWQF